MPYLGSGSVMEWPPEHGDARLRRRLDASLQHAGEHREREVIHRPRRDVQREEGGTSHGVDVRHRVGGSDASPVVRVVHDRREEVERGDDRAIVVHLPDGGVIAGVDAHQHLGRDVGQSQRVDHRPQLVGSQLAATTGPVAEGRESPFGVHPPSLRTRRRSARAGRLHASIVAMVAHCSRSSSRKARVCAMELGPSAPLRPGSVRRRRSSSRRVNVHASVFGSTS